jgi:hypothetical protein
VKFYGKGVLSAGAADPRVAVNDILCDQVGAACAADNDTTHHPRRDAVMDGNNFGYTVNI